VGAIEIIRKEHYLKGLDRYFSVYCDGVWELRGIAKKMVKEELEKQGQVKSNFEVAELAVGKLAEIMKVRRFVMTRCADERLSPEQELLLERSRLGEGREEAFLEATAKLKRAFGANLPIVAANWAENYWAKK